MEILWPGSLVMFLDYVFIHHNSDSLHFIAQMHKQLESIFQLQGCLHELGDLAIVLTAHLGWHNLKRVLYQLIKVWKGKISNCSLQWVLRVGMATRRNVSNTCGWCTIDFLSLSVIIRLERSTCSYDWRWYDDPKTCFTCNFSRKLQNAQQTKTRLSLAIVIGTPNRNTKCSNKNWTLVSKVADG